MIDIGIWYPEAAATQPLKNGKLQFTRRVKVFDFACIGSYLEFLQDNFVLQWRGDHFFAKADHVGQICL